MSADRQRFYCRHKVTKNLSYLSDYEKVHLNPIGPAGRSDDDGGAGKKSPPTPAGVRGPEARNVRSLRPPDLPDSRLDRSRPQPRSVQSGQAGHRPMGQGRPKRRDEIHLRLGQAPQRILPLGHKDHGLQRDELTSAPGCPAGTGQFRPEGRNADNVPLLDP